MGKRERSQAAAGARGKRRKDTPKSMGLYGTLFLARRAGMELRRTGSMFALKILSET